MMRDRIIVCCDGTGNDTRDNGKLWSNVARIAECISVNNYDHVNQIVGYLSGIGTDEPPVSGVLRKATGLGIDAKIRRAYKFIARSYRPGDSIVLIGFSRGAFTACCIAAFISDVGVIYENHRNWPHFEAIYKEWKKLMKTKNSTDIRQELFSRYNGEHQSNRVVEAVAVWDTVSSIHLGWHAKHLELVNTTLPVHVKNAFHALSLGEHRSFFPPAVWKGEKLPDDVQTVKQCWFRGMHSHVGGSNKQYGNNISNVSLMWMIAQLSRRGLVCFDNDRIKRVIACEGTAEMIWQSGSNSGIADSNSKSWDIAATLARERGGPRTPGQGIGETYHWSVFDQPDQPLQPIPPLLQLAEILDILVEEKQSSENDLEELACGWSGTYFNQTEKYLLTPEEAFSRLYIDERPMFDIERFDRQTGNYENAKRGRRYYNVFHLEKKRQNPPGSGSPPRSPSPDGPSVREGLRASTADEGNSSTRYEVPTPAVPQPSTPYYEAVEVLNTQEDGGRATTVVQPEKRSVLIPQYGYQSSWNSGASNIQGHDRSACEHSYTTDHNRDFTGNQDQEATAVASQSYPSYDINHASTSRPTASGLHYSKHQTDYRGHHEDNYYPTASPDAFDSRVADNNPGSEGATDMDHDDLRYGVEDPGEVRRRRKSKSRAVEPERYGRRR